MSVLETKEVTSSETKIIPTAPQKESIEEENAKTKEANEEKSKNPTTNLIPITTLQRPPIIPSLFNLSSSSEEALSGGLKNKSTEDDDSW